MIEERHYDIVLAKKDAKINRLMLENAALKEKVEIYEKAGGPSFKESQLLISKLKEEKLQLLEENVRIKEEIRYLKER